LMELVMTDEHAFVPVAVVSAETPAERQEATRICSNHLHPPLSASGLAVGPRAWRQRWTGNSRAQDTIPSIGHLLSVASGLRSAG
jgi:hypothetical protein